MNNEKYGQKQFSALIDSYQNLVFSICYKMTSDYFASEDLTQETFISVYRNLNSFDGENEKAWICRIATNKCIDYMRKSEQNNVATEDVELENELCKSQDPVNATSTTDPERATLEKEVRDTLLKHCSDLKPPYDEIARLYYYEELDAKEIALKKGLNLKTVQTQIYRAREMLRKKYSKKYPGEYSEKTEHPNFSERRGWNG